MANLKIPKGKTYTFSVTVLEKDSYLPKDLANMDDLTSTFTLVESSTLTPVAGTISIVKVPDPKINPTDPNTYLNGKTSITILNTITSTLVYERGDKVDDYYLKPTYEGIVSIKFTDGTPEIVAVLPNILIVPIGI